VDTQPQHGYLVLADISGYTGFMAGTELAHAHAIIAELLELIVGRMTPALTLSKLEGDAVFAFASATNFSRGESLLELIEATYVAFRDHVEGIRRRTTCQCNACRAVPNLELKFLAHCGEYIEQMVAGTHELVGSDVNLVHRLLKNHVVENTGCRAYALFTRGCLACMGMSSDGMCEQVETYEHLGEVHAYCLDLHERYEALSSSRHIVVQPEEADVMFTCDCDAPPAIVWDWANDPLKRSQWMCGTNWTAGLRPSGRTGAGARNHCAHGKESSMEVIIDWHPVDYVTSEMYAGDGGRREMIQTVSLEPLENGRRTRVVARLKMIMPLPKFLRHLIGTYMMTKLFKYDQAFAMLAKVVPPTVSMSRETVLSHDAHLHDQPHS
jgi:uncharacterized protein YndB with AHSA1/START domain